MPCKESVQPGTILKTNSPVEITNLMHEYKEAIRSLWNSHIRKHIRPDYQTSDFYKFQQIQILLLEKIVLDRFGERADQFTTLSLQRLGCIWLQLASSSITELCLEQFEDGKIISGRWGYPTLPYNKLACHLEWIDFFDWEELGYMDCHYQIVVIRDAKNHPELEGRRALIEANSGKYFFYNGNDLMAMA